MDLVSGDGRYRLCTSAGGFRVERVAPLVVGVVRGDGNGGPVRETTDVTQVIPGYSGTVLDVWGWDGSGWSVDCEAGALRWSGRKGNRSVRNALCRLGFIREQIQDVVHHARRSG